MLFDEGDIDFLKLSDRQFEEACFDLLLSLDYQGLIWRQGGSDSGRDIEGRRTTFNSLVGEYDEKWFFECKRYEKGVPPEVLNSKLAWADAERPNHLVLFLSSHLTDGARNWLEKLTPQKPYAVHVVEGKALKKVFLRFPEVVSRYFLDPETKLLLDSRKAWLVHNIVPEPETLGLLLSKLDFNKLSTAELAFLWCSAKLRNEEIEQWFEEHEPFSLDFMLGPLSQAADSLEPIITERDDISVEQVSKGFSNWDVVYIQYLTASLVMYSSTKPRRGMYAFVKDSEGKGLEVLIVASSDFVTRIRHVETGAQAEIHAAAGLLSRSIGQTGKSHRNESANNPGGQPVR